MRINTKAFIGRRQSKHTHIVLVLANVDAVTSLAVNFGDNVEESQLLLTCQVQKLADLFSLTQFRNFVEKYKAEAHVPHIMLVQCQSIFAAIAQVSTNTQLQNLVLSQAEILRIAYLDVIALFKVTWWDAKCLVNSYTLGVYQKIPYFYVPVAQKVSCSNNDDKEELKLKRPRKSEKGKYDDTKKEGWLILTSSTVRWPKTLKIQPCKNFYTVGSFCRHQSCCFSHDKFPSGYTCVDQKTIVHLVNGANNARFAKCVLAADLEALRGPSLGKSIQDAIAESLSSTKE